MCGLRHEGRGADWQRTTTTTATTTTTTTTQRRPKHGLGALVIQYTTLMLSTWRPLPAHVHHTGWICPLTLQCVDTGTQNQTPTVVLCCGGPELSSLRRTPHMLPRDGHMVLYGERCIVHTSASNEAKTGVCCQHISNDNSRRRTIAASTCGCALCMSVDCTLLFDIWFEWQATSNTGGAH